LTCCDGIVSGVDTHHMEISEGKKQGALNNFGSIGPKRNHIYQ